MSFEVVTGLNPVDAVFTFTQPDGEQKQLAVEIDGSSHFYALERHPTTRTELKRRLYKGAGVNMLSLEYFDYVEEGEKTLKIDRGKIISAIRDELERTKKLPKTVQVENIFTDLLLN